MTIRGYDGEAMEPFITRDGRYLLFNDSNEAPDTNLYYAVRADDLTFDFRGQIAGANSAVLDAVPSLDASGNLYTSRPAAISPTCRRCTARISPTAPRAASK